jgi:nitrite reductase/ring-hydroxylating ferredoxin subunit
LKSELDHWHPVLLSRELGAKPVAVRVCDQEIVVFRTLRDVGALADRCPHRGFPLHRGRVEGDRLVCPYHGWRWAADGHGVSPANPRAKPCAEAFACIERFGAVWVKRAASEAPFPTIDASGHTLMGTSHHTAKAPLELVLDNFIEVEHTPSVHAFVGYPAERMHEVETETTVAGDSVRVCNHGPGRGLPWPVARMLGVPGGAFFVDDWTAYFSPVHVVYEQRFLDGARGARVGDAFRLAVFLTPRGPRETAIFVFAYHSLDRRQTPLRALVQLPLIMAMVNLEVARDCSLLQHMGDAPLSLKNRALGRFDEALVASRKCLERVYRGQRDGSLKVVGGG